MIVIMGVIVLLVGIILPQALFLRERAKVALVKLQLNQIAEALEMARTDIGFYPCRLNDLSCAELEGVEGWRGPYFEKIPLTDPWGNPYFYDAWEGEETVFTSPLLRRHTPPSTDRFYFQAPPGEYTIHLDLYRVSSARIWINGEEIFHPNEFNALVETLEKNIYLEEYNELEVRLVSNPECTMVITIVSPRPPLDIDPSTLPPLEYAGKGYNWSYIYGWKKGIGRDKISQERPGAFSGTGSEPGSGEMREIEEVKIYIDGGALGNPGKAAIGGVLYGEGNKKLKEYSLPIGVSTNNQAEYFSLIYALLLARSLNLRRVQILTDSELLYRQWKGVYKVKHPSIRFFYNMLKLIRKDFQKIDIVHISREENREADKLVRKALRTPWGRSGGCSSG